MSENAPENDTRELPRIPTEDSPDRIPLFAVPKAGIAFQFPNGTEHYLRACPRCGSYMTVVTSSGDLPKFRCPLRADGRCTQEDLPLARMSRGLAKDLASIRCEETCWKCGKPVVMEIHKRRERVEILCRHRAGDACKAQRVYTFHTFDSAKNYDQQWEEEPGKMDESVLDGLEEWDRDRAKKEIRDSKIE